MSILNSFHRLNLGVSILADFNQDIARQVKGVLLDVGCGAKQEIFKAKVEQYIGMDFPVTAKINKQDEINHVDIFANAENLPFKKESFDSVVALSVFEHLSNPQQSSSEIYRVLKKEGIFAATVPFLNRIHMAPFDFYRFTLYGIRHLVESSGFKIIKILDGGGMWKVICIRLAGYLYSDLLGLGYGIDDLTVRPKKYLLPFFAPLILWLLVMAIVLDKIHCVKKDSLYYYVLAQKP